MTRRVVHAARETLAWLGCSLWGALEWTIYTLLSIGYVAGMALLIAVLVLVWPVLALVGLVGRFRRRRMIRRFRQRLDRRLSGVAQPTTWKGRP